MATEKDFRFISWDEYQHIVNDIYKKVDTYCKQNHYSINFIVPIMRGGTVLAVSLSHMLNVIKILPCQFKYTKCNDEYVPVELLPFTLDYGLDANQEYLILVTEGNHCSGTTAQLCISSILNVCPNSKIIYASIGRDYGHRNKLNGTMYETQGFYTNEGRSVPESECRRLNVMHKLSIYPWETLDEEMEEVNSSTYI